MSNLAIGLGQANRGNTDVASAATVDLSAVTTERVTITGSTGITAITMRAGQQLLAVFAGSLTITPGGTLTLQGGAAYTTQASDHALLLADASANVYVAFVNPPATGVRL